MKFARFETTLKLEERLRGGRGGDLLGLDVQPHIGTVTPKRHIGRSDVSKPATLGELRMR